MWNSRARDGMDGSNSTSRVTALRHCAALLLVVALGGCEHRHLSFEGAWDVAPGAHPAGRAPWMGRTFPLRLDASHAEAGWITVRRWVAASELPALDAGSGLSLYTGTVSDVSRFFWNGTEIGRLGRAEPYRSGAAKRAIVQIPTESIRPRNELRVLLYSNGRYPRDLADPSARIGETSSVYRWYYVHEIANFVLLGLFVSVGLYHLLLAAFRERALHDRYFGFFCLASSVYWFFLGGSRDLFFPDPALRWRIEFAALFVSGPLFALFYSHLVWDRCRRFVIVYGVASLVPLALLLPESYALWKAALRGWQSITLLVATLLVAAGIRLARARTEARFLLAGLVVFLSSVVHDVVRDMARFDTVPLSKYGFAFLLLGVAVGLARRAVATQAAVEELNRTLDQKVAERTAQLEETLDALRKKLRAEETAHKLAEILSKREVERKVIAGRALVYDSAAMREVMATVERFAVLPSPVLITGETGTGKELFARLIHERSRPREPFVAVNCAAIPNTLWEGEVFGHAAGAYTDARGDRAGLIARAGAGTLLFDEIGEVPLAMQAKMLRMLEERTFTPLGAERAEAVRCRILFATHRSLESMAAAGAFRHDLMYRINVLQLRLPPLRERREDIPHLTGFFLETYARKFGRNVAALEEGALRKLASYDWPGNVRELENVIIRALAIATGDRITEADVQLPIGARTSEPFALDASVDVTVSTITGAEETPRVCFKALMADHAGRLIRAALARANGNVNQAARILGLRRSSLDYRIRELGIEVARHRAPE